MTPRLTLLFVGAASAAMPFREAGKSIATEVAPTGGAPLFVGAASAAMPFREADKSIATEVAPTGGAPLFVGAASAAMFLAANHHVRRPTFAVAHSMRTHHG